MSYRNTTENSPKKTSPHHRITVKDVIRDYQAGLLTPAGAIFYLVAATRRMGQSIRVSVTQICSQLHLSRATYYRAIGTLEEEGRLQISAPDEMVLKVPISTTEGIPDYIFLNELSQICDKNSQICDRNSQICDKDSQICDNERLEPLYQAAPAIPQLDQLDQSFKQLTTEEEVSPTPHPVENDLEESGIELTESQLNQLQGFSDEQIKTAIDVVKGSKQVRDKVKFFFKALRNGWRSNLPREIRASFIDWFEAARANGLVLASQNSAEGILIYLSDGRCLPLSEAMQEVES